MGAESCARELTMLPGSQKWRAAVTRAGPGGGVALQANWCQRVRHFRTPGPPLTLLSTRRDRLLMIGDALRARTRPEASDAVRSLLGVR